MSNQSFDLNLDHVLIDTNATKSHNVYHDSNTEQVLVCKDHLHLFKSKIGELLANEEFVNHPLLLELLKLIDKLESFNLNDPVMKYLTGIEILLGKSESWKRIAPKVHSMEAELKQLSTLVIEWRKMELKYWLDSIDVEHLKIKKKTSFLWFFNMFSVCNEFLASSNGSESSSSRELMHVLNLFLQNSTNGEYFVRLRCLEACHLIYKSKFPAAKRVGQKVTQLVDMLGSLIGYYQSLFTRLIEHEMSETRRQVKKELKDFIDIYKWQDWNYLSLKQSIDKVTIKAFFKIILFQSQEQKKTKTTLLSFNHFILTLSSS